MLIDPPMTTFLFGDRTIAAVTSGVGEYDHTFGGPPDRAGTSRRECFGLHIHLLHRFELTDPAVPISVPGVRRLPIYYCFDFRVNDLGYRLLSDDALEAFIPADDENVAAVESWPGDGYPMEFSRSAVSVAQYPYDPTDLDDAYAWAGVFGIDQLSPADQAVAKQRVAELAEGLGMYPPETAEEFHDALSLPFAQERPNNTCLNPVCGNHVRRGQLTTVALVPAEPVTGVLTFGEYGGGVMLIVEKCPACHTFRVSNQST